MKTFTDYIKEAIEAIGLDAHLRSYSGRGMYGSSCVGVVCSMQEFVQIVTQAAIDADKDEDCDINFSYDVSKVSSDSMGLSTIYYWPSQKWLPEYDTSDVYDDD